MTLGISLGQDFEKSFVFAFEKAQLYGFGGFCVFSVIRMSTARYCPHQISVHCPKIHICLKGFKT